MGRDYSIKYTVVDSEIQLGEKYYSMLLATCEPRAVSLGYYG